VPGAPAGGLTGAAPCLTVTVISWVWTTLLEVSAWQW
jgi:hypothetical protein